MSELKFNFGKYALKTMKEVVMEDPNYCRWVISQPFCPPEAKEFILKNMDTAPTMPWGKHKGKKLSYINSTDRKYIKWLLSSKDVKESFSDLYALLKALPEAVE